MPCRKESLCNDRIAFKRNPLYSSLVKAHKEDDSGVVMFGFPFCYISCI